MRIGVIGPHRPDDMADNVLHALGAMGHVGLPLGPAYPRGGVPIRALVEAGRQATRVDELLQRRVVRLARDAELSVVISVETTLLPATVAALQRFGTKVALWFPDCIANLGRSLLYLATYDAVFVKEPHLVERTRALLETPIHYLPEACNPTWHRPPDDVRATPFVVVAGNMYPSRVRLLERLDRAGVPLRLYGSGWPRWIHSPVLERCHTRRYVTRHEKARVFRSAAAVLNNLHPAELDGVNCRLFEAAGCGAAVLCETRPELERHFDPKHEVLAFDDFDELVDRARYLLDQREDGRRMGDAASRRAHRDHTYQQRLNRILEVLVCRA
jgi:spore maturation protein CgeB